MQDAAKAGEVEPELADVLWYLLRLADVLRIDLAAVVRRKMQINGQRLPPSHY